MNKKVPGKHIEVNGGAADGSIFFMCDSVIAADACDGITTRPQVAKDGEKRVYAMLTFLGADRKGESTGVTLIMHPEMLRALARDLRQLYRDVPIQYRDTGQGEDWAPDDLAAT